MAEVVCLVHLVYLVYLVYLVCLVCLVDLVCLVKPNKRDRPEQPAGCLRVTDVESAAWGKARPWAKRLSWQLQGGRVK